MLKAPRTIRRTKKKDSTSPSLSLAEIQLPIKAPRTPPKHIAISKDGAKLGILRVKILIIILAI